MFDKDQSIVLEPEGSHTPSAGHASGLPSDPKVLQKVAKHRQKAAQTRARIARLKTKIERLKHLVQVLEERAQRHDATADELGGGKTP